MVQKNYGHCFGFPQTSYSCERPSYIYFIHEYISRAQSAIVRRIYTVIYIGQVATEHVIGEIRFVVSTSNRGSYRRRADITNPLK